MCTALTEKDWLGQVTFVESNVFSKTLVIIHNTLFIKALFPVSWLKRSKWSLCSVWIPRSWVCTAGKHIAFVWLIIHWASSFSLLTKKAYVSYAADEFSWQNFINAMKVNPSKERNNGLFLQLTGGKQFSVLLWIADDTWIAVLVL